MKKLSAGFWWLILIVLILCSVPAFTFVDDFVAPLLFNSRIERLAEIDLPKASVENGCLYVRMKADDFRLRLPSGYRPMLPVITQGGFDRADGSIELRFDSSNAASMGSAGSSLGRLQDGASASIGRIPGRILIRFHYFGDR